MNKFNLIIIFLLIVLTNTVTVFYTKTFMNSRLDKLSTYDEERKSSIEHNSRLLKGIELKLSDIQNNTHYPTEGLGNQKSIATIDQSKLKKNEHSIEQLETKFVALKKELHLLTSEMQSSVDKVINSLASNDDIKLAINEPETVEDIRKIVEKESLQINLTYETAFNEGVEDSIWTTDLESTIGELATNNKLGKSVTLQDVNCHSDLCKVVLSHPENSINLQNLAISLNNSFTTVSNHTDASGMQKTVIYVAQKGKDLPTVNLQKP